MIGRPASEWLDIAGASVRLGVSPEALRKRIKRGTVASEKRDGRWFVQVDNDPDTAWTKPDSVQDAVQDNGRDALVEQLRSENARLWEELESRREETRRLHILAAQQQDSISELAGRVQALSAGPEQPTQPEPTDTSPVDEATIWASQPPEEAINRWWLEVSQDVPEEPQSSDSTSNSLDLHKGSDRPWWAFWRS